MATATERIQHQIDPVFDERSRVLLLGTMPSPKSREEGFFYGHPRNRFWLLMSTLFDEPIPETIEDKKDLLLRHHIALWDVLESCSIEGASDASIRDPKPNDLGRIFETAAIQGVFATGTKAGELYRKLCEPGLRARFGREQGVACETLPSTSPANATRDFDSLHAIYGNNILPLLAPAAPVTLSVPDVIRLEQAIAERGTSLAALMERAGRFLGYYAMVDSIKAGMPTARMAVLCGFGNNGGDGWVAARYLADAGFETTLITPIAAEDLKAQPARDAAMAAQEFLDACEGAQVLVAPDAKTLETTLAQADVIVDALLGTGFSGDAVRAPFDAWINLANAQRGRGARIVAADVPSGLSAQTGKAASPCIKADLTVTMICQKPGLVTPYAFAFCGNVKVAPIAYIEPILDAWKREQSEAAAKTSDAQAPKAQKSRPGVSAKTAVKRDEFHRPEAEDDDGYDPYSDRRPEPEPLFQSDPWN